MSRSSVPAPQANGAGGLVAATFALGFRPFFLAAALFAVIAVPVWMAVHVGGIAPDGYLSGVDWHGHEMLFGFAPAVIAGFLLTATRQWTGLPTPTGGVLAALLALWVAGRILVVTGPAIAALTVDGLFLPSLALAVGRPIWKSRNHRNLPVVAILGALALANLLFHLGAAGAVDPAMGWAAIRIALDILTILMAVIGGRIIPAFTANAIPSARPRRLAPLEHAAIGLLVLVLALDLLALRWAFEPRWLAGCLAVAAVAHGVRLALWSPVSTRSEPLLWILPLSYGWIPAALALRAAAMVFDAVDIVASVHALGLGAMGGLMLAMMTRTALGHTGRPLTAGPAEILAFLLIHAAALLRIVPGMLWPSAYWAGLGLSTACWSAAFMLYLVRYGPILTRPRVDGRPG